jgi:hypothetical protein
MLFALYARRLSFRATSIGWKIQILVEDMGVVETIEFDTAGSPFS